MFSEFVKGCIKQDEEDCISAHRLHSIQDSYDSLHDEIEKNISFYRAFARQRALLLQSLRESERLLYSYRQYLHDVEPRILNLKSILFQRLYLYIVRVLLRVL